MKLLTLAGCSMLTLSLHAYGQNYLQPRKIISASSGKLADVSGVSQDNSAVVWGWDDVGGANQHWQIIPLGNGYNKFVNVNSGKVLDLTGQCMGDNGCQLQQYDWLNNGNQQWQINTLGNGNSEIFSLATGRAMDLDAGCQYSNGCKIQQWDWGGGGNQQWQLVPVDTGYTPYGLDMELFGCGTWSGGNCQALDYAQSAHGQWVRVFAPWRYIEPNPPTGPGNPNVNGQMSGQHSYDWSLVDTEVNNAISRGMNVYLQIWWTAPWANGNPFPDCSPSATGDQCYVNGQPQGNPEGYVPTINTAYLQDFAYNLAARYNGLVSFYGPMNEPNIVKNFNPCGQGLTDCVGSYLSYYVTYVERPVRAGIKAANSSNQLVGPDVALGVCSVPGNGTCAGGRDSWVLPLTQYFSGEFDVWSVHTYRSDHDSVRSDMDGVNSVTNYSHPVWLTETGFPVNNDPNNQANQVQGLYIDEYNRSDWWTKTFYHSVTPFGVTDPSQDDGLVDLNWNPRSAFYMYQGLYGH